MFYLLEGEIIMELKKINKTKRKESKKIYKNEKKRYKKLINEDKHKYNIMVNSAPKRGVLEEVGNSITHGVGALVGVLGLVLLLMNSNSKLELTASLVYGISIVMMMLMSCLYHAFKCDTVVKRIFRRFDYIGIYLLIGGTFAPIYLIYYGNTLGVVLFCIQWLLIIIGITFISIFGPGRVKILNFILYFAIGWSGIMFIPDFIKNNINLLNFILLGGLVYTFGMIPFSMKKSKISHFIWHFCVIFGALIQYLGIIQFIY
jgi:hemolysin III